MRLFSIVVCLGTMQAAVAPPVTIEHGYRAMYDLRFADAHRIFAEWQKLHPEDPFASVSDAAAYLFTEFERLHILEAEFFLDDQGFKKGSKLTPDPLLKANFERTLGEADRLATAALSKSADDKNAIFAKIMVHGLRSDYQGLIEKRYLASLSEMQAGRKYAERLLQIDPKFGDAHLAIGVENYVLSLKPMAVRWLLRAYGSETDSVRAAQKIQLCMESCLYMKPFARLLQAVAAVREKKYDRAREILHALAREFPSNPLYVQQAAKLPK